MRLPIESRQSTRALFLALTLFGCENGNDDPACPPMGASFRLQVTTGSGAPLPPGTRLTVQYQGNVKESYLLGSSPPNEDICCRPGMATNGRLPAVDCQDSASLDAAAAASAEAIHCELWTEGQAELTVRAAGYEERTDTLAAPAPEDPCDHETLDVSIVLSMPEGGSSGGR